MKDFDQLYKLQDKFLTWLLTLNMPVYLTGGTALGRFYLEHRFCNNLYLHVNEPDRYLNYISELTNKLKSSFSLNLKETTFNEDFTSLAIAEDETILQIELIRNMNLNLNILSEYKYGLIDTPANILPKKLKAILWRNDVEDIFDIVHIAHNYSFNWGEINSHRELFSKYKMSDVRKRIATHPTGKLKKANWLKSPIDTVAFKKELEQIAYDFETGANNSLGLNKLPIEMAKPL